MSMKSIQAQHTHHPCQRKSAPCLTLAWQMVSTPLYRAAEERVWKHGEFCRTCSSAGAILASRALSPGLHPQRHRNPSTWEVRAGGLGVPGFPPLCIQFKTSLGYRRYRLRKQTNRFKSLKALVYFFIQSQCVQPISLIWRVNPHICVVAFIVFLKELLHII